MENSVFIAKLLAILYLAVGIGMLVDPKFYRSVFKDYQEHASPVYLGGIMALISGYLIIHFHNSWELKWHVAITVIGWLGLIKGLTLLIYPQCLVRQNFGRLRYSLTVATALALGGYLAWFGFFA